MAKLTCVACIAVFALACADGNDGSGDAPTRDQAIAAAIRQLGDADAQARDAAYRHLQEEGEASRAALEQAQDDASADRAGRAKRLLAELDGYDNLADPEVKFQVRGYCFAGSAVKDDQAPGGFGPSDNLPRKVRPADLGAKPAAGGIQLVARPEERAVFGGKYKGFALYLLNAGNRRAAFSASDSRLYLVREAKDDAGQWKPIEYLPSSWCGNSYHRVFLDPGQGWRFTAPRYSGPVKTKLRFKLTPDGRQGEAVYSNEFDGSIHTEQFQAKQGHTPTDIMDPYLD